MTTVKTARTRKPALRNQWVVCDSYVAGPYTAEVAQRVYQKASTSMCSDQHRIITSARKPVPAADLRALRAEWDLPFPVDYTDEDPYTDRTALTRELAEGIMAAQLGTRLGELTIVAGGWSKTTADRADADYEPGTPEWMQALGPREHATLTSDGRAVNRDAWCRCTCPEKPGQWVEYEGWVPSGRQAHGFACGTCRKVIQTG